MGSLNRYTYLRSKKNIKIPTLLVLDAEPNFHNILRLLSFFFLLKRRRNSKMVHNCSIFPQVVCLSWSVRLGPFLYFHLLVLRFFIATGGSSSLFCIDRTWNGKRNRGTKFRRTSWMSLILCSSIIASTVACNNSDAYQHSKQCFITWRISWELYSH